MVNEAKRVDRSVVWTIVGALCTALFIPGIMAVGTFFSLQSDLRHLEQRLTADEVDVVKDISHLEQRIHTMELDTARRLAAIETTLAVIETYMLEINEYIARQTGTQWDP